MNCARRDVGPTCAQSLFDTYPLFEEGTMNNRAVSIALKVLFAASLSAAIALVVSTANSQQITADMPTPAARYKPALSPATEEVVPTSTDNQSTEPAPKEHKTDPTEPDSSPILCPLGYMQLGDQCVFTGCPIGYIPEDGDCVPLDLVLPCPDGFARNAAGDCLPDIDFGLDILRPCPAGLIWFNGHCVPVLEIGPVQPDFDFNRDLTNKLVDNGFPGV